MHFVLLSFNVHNTVKSLPDQCETYSWRHAMILQSLARISQCDLYQTSPDLILANIVHIHRQFAVTIISLHVISSLFSLHKNITCPLAFSLVSVLSVVWSAATECWCPADWPSGLIAFCCYCFPTSQRNEMYAHNFPSSNDTCNLGLRSLGVRGIQSMLLDLDMCH